jgi:hypothetical protein
MLKEILTLSFFAFSLAGVYYYSMRRRLNREVKKDTIEKYKDL